MVVEINTVVSIQYKMKNNKGELLEETIEGFPVSYIHGSGAIMPALEKELYGLRKGDKQLIVISEERGFEDADNDFYMEVVIDDVRAATPSELADGLFSPDKTNWCGPEGCC